jgi:thiol-disulfide isomerase/thioredoxin
MMTGLVAALSPREMDSVVDFVLSIAPKPTKGPPVPRDVNGALRKAGFNPSSADRAAPPLSARGAEGESVTLDRLRGKLVLIVFWGTSCAPCLKELPHLERVADQYRGQGFAVVPVCVDVADTAVARRVAADQAPRLPVYIDPTGAAKLSYDVQTLPAAVLVAPNVCLLGHAQGSVRWSAPEMDALIRMTLHRDPACPSESPFRSR